MSTIRTQYVGPLTGVATPTFPVAFSAYLTTTSQTVTNATFTKVTINTEEFDTNNNYDPTTNYRFTPTVPGYYQFSWSAQGTATGAVQATIASLYKNGSRFKDGSVVAITGSASYAISTGSSLVYMNGTTDYVELYGYVSGSGTMSIGFGSYVTYLSGFLAVAA